MDVLDRVKENIIEVTMVYIRLLRENKICVEDGFDGKLEICSLADQFEELYGGLEWSDTDLDYYEEIEKFARTNLLDKFPVQQIEITM